MVHNATQMKKIAQFMNCNPDKLAAFFTLLDKRQRENEEQKAKERKEAEDKKLKRIRAWWQEAAQ